MHAGHRRARQCFTFETERRGAREVIAVDNEPPTNTGFAIAELLDSKTTYVTENVYSLLGVIYHLRHPRLALGRLHDVCAPDAIVALETHMIDEDLVDPSGSFHQLQASHEDLAVLSLVQYYPGSMLGAASTSQWAPSRGRSRGDCAGRASSQCTSGRTPCTAVRCPGASSCRRRAGARSMRPPAGRCTWTVDRSTNVGNR